ncbi:MAG: pyridoxine 5'-phosphate synthase, partial [Verrucomicrobia bacterium]|nr:pyridoxine 5'-phosphate synthase [Verrucomicrobiota bacterium]
MTTSRSLLLGVNIDHAATLRQARYNPFAHNAEPLVLEAARQSLAAGAIGITVHLRADRRHIQDADVHAIAAIPGVRLNLEMACTPAMTAFALKLKPAAVCLVPESREEVTTEGGLDVAGQLARVKETTHALKAAGIEVSLFIGPDAHQIDAAVAVGAPVIEL